MVIDLESLKKILVLCTGNSCRSQMAEGYLRYFLGTHAQVYSAGIETHGLNPNAIRVMAQDGVDISWHTSDNIDKYLETVFDFIITVCDNAKETCPYFPSGAIKLHYNFPDPAKSMGTDQEINAEFIRVRDMIKHYCRDFVTVNF